MTNWLKKRFEGRMGRKEFLLPGLVLVVLLVSAIIFTYVVIFSNNSIVIGYLFLIPLLIPFIPAITRRLHDTGLSGRFSLAWFLLTLIAFYGYLIIFVALSAYSDPGIASRTSIVKFLSITNQENLLPFLTLIILSGVYTLLTLFLFF